jgi:hypothetical protein
MTTCAEVYAGETGSKWVGNRGVHSKPAAYPTHDEISLSPIPGIRYSAT